MNRYLALIAVSFLACSGKREPAPGSGSGSGTGSGAGSAASMAAEDPWQGSGSATVPGPPTITLEDPGAAPRRVVRYEVAASKRSVVFETVQWIRGHDMKIELHVDWSCETGGTCHYQLTRFEMPGMPREPAFETIAKATAGDVEIKADGTALIRPTSLMKTTPSVTELLRLAIVRFPVEPIGVGATWLLDEADLRRTYTLLASGRDAIEVRVELAYKTSGKAVVTGRLEIVLADTDPLPRSWHGTQHTRHELGADVIEQKTEMRLR